MSKPYSIPDSYYIAWTSNNSGDSRPRGVSGWNENELREFSKADRDRLLTAYRAQLVVVNRRSSQVEHIGSKYPRRQFEELRFQTLATGVALPWAAPSGTVGVANDSPSNQFTFTIPRESNRTRREDGRYAVVQDGITVATQDADSFSDDGTNITLNYDTSALGSGSYAMSIAWLNPNGSGQTAPTAASPSSLTKP